MNDKLRTPTATYRLQLNRAFTFRDAAALVPYLSALGISHCYVSPYLRARAGSMHGYDIIDHNALNPEIGTPDDYEHFVAELHRNNMGQILDIVPNHMGVMGTDNSWWLDVLENGEASEYAEFFDIDWDPIKDELQGKVLVPVLGDQYGNELERGRMKLVFDREHGEFSIVYGEHRFPVDPNEYPRILGFQLEQLKEKIGATHGDFLELQSIATAFGHLPGRRGLTHEQQAERNREKEVQKRRLAALCARSRETCDFLASTVERYNGTPDDPRSYDALHDLIKAQVARLAYWRVATDDINYRRFFDINDLAALRTENESVFTHTHRFILELVARGKVDGLRIDHPDGLYDPAKYFQRLQNSLAKEGEGTKKNIYIVAEKILTGKEQLRKDWPLDGTTGYEFANLANGLFVDPTAADKLQRVYRSFSGVHSEFHDLVYNCKKLILKTALASELNVLANLLIRIALANRHTCDFTLNSLRGALAEIIASFPVYRTYVSEREVSEEDRRYVEQAVATGRKRSNTADPSVFDFVRGVLLIDVNGSEPGWYKRAITRFAMKFQQVTSAVMAKGVEDTAFYRYNRLTSLNEVGGNPSKFATSVEEFHRSNQDRFASWPNSMLSSSTHDSKRSEDVRARINVLSEIPEAWLQAVRRWRDLNRSKKRMIDEERAPTPNDEYLLYQTLVGAWPLGRLTDEEWSHFNEKIEQYMLKAAREAKEHTSWANADTAYESALSGFTRAVLDRTRTNPFLADFEDFQRPVARIGLFNSLSQCLLKMTAPGVPDIYQGNELWHFALVDPDNRQPIDYDQRRRLFDRLQQDTPSPKTAPENLAELLANPQDGRLKMYLTWKTLSLRRQEAALFQNGNYLPLRVEGAKSHHIVAFAREFEGRTAIVAVPRLSASLLSDTSASLWRTHMWGDTRVELPDTAAKCYHHAFTGECIPASAEDSRPTLEAGSLLGDFPVALLLSAP